MATEALVKQLRDISKDCTQTPINKLISNLNRGDMNFGSTRIDLERAFNIFKELLILPIDILPDRAIETIINHAEPLKNKITEIRSFDSIFGIYAVSPRDRIANTLKENVDDFYAISHPWISYLVYKKDGFQNKVDELTNAITNAKDEIATKKEEVDEIVIAIREASASVVVSRFSANFSDEAESLRKSARWWLITTVVFGGVTLSASMAFFFHALVPENIYAAVQMVTTKLIILGLLFSVTLWCGRIYKALMHQVTVNKHRANSIKTFQAFTKAASNDAVRDAVLMETTKAIFGQSSTGYLDKEMPGAGDQLRIIEVAKQMPTPPQAGTTKSS